MNPADSTRNLGVFFDSGLNFRQHILQVITDLQKWQLVQNCLARVVTKAQRFSSSIPLLKSLHWLPIMFRIQFKICTFAFRCLNDGQPSYLSSLLFSADSVKHLRSNNANKLKVHRIRTNFGAHDKDGLRL